MRIEDAYTRWSSTYDEDRNLTRDLDRSVTEKIFDFTEWSHPNDEGGRPRLAVFELTRRRT